MANVEKMDILLDIMDIYIMLSMLLYINVLCKRFATFAKFATF